MTSDAWFAARRLGPAGRLVGGALLRGFPSSERMVGPDSDVCIEGFPRSANTFAYYAFRAANPDARIAHHLHTPVQVARAVDLGVPCAVTIRQPLDAISSFLIFDQGKARAGEAIRRYVGFYRRLVALRGRIALCRFEEILDDPSVVARNLNLTFGTEFRAEPLDAAERAGLVAEIERDQREEGREVSEHALPRARRDELKPEVRRRVASHPRLQRAEAIYAKLVAPEGIE